MTGWTDEARAAAALVHHGHGYGKPVHHPRSALSPHALRRYMHEAIRHVTGPSRPSDWGMRDNGNQNQTGSTGNFYNIYQKSKY